MERENGRFVPELMRIAGFKSRLLAIPEALHAARLKRAEADRDIATVKKHVADAKEAVKDLENEVAFEVAGAMLPPAESGTAPRVQFSNETSRKAETQRRLKLSPGYHALITSVDAAEASLFQAEHASRLRALDVEKLEDEQRALQTHSDLTVSETMLLIAGR